MKKALLFLVLFFFCAGYGEIIIPNDKLEEVLEMRGEEVFYKETGEVFTGIYITEEGEDEYKRRIENHIENGTVKKFVEYINDVKEQEMYIDFFTMYGELAAVKARIVQYYKNGNIKSDIWTDNITGYLENTGETAYHPFKIYYENGLLHSQGKCIARFLDNCESFYEDYEVYASDGQLLYKEEFGNEGTGYFKGYTPEKDSVLYEEGFQVEGKREGKWITYNYDNGKTIYNYKNNYEEGEARTYNDKGRLVKIEKYRGGSLIRKTKK